ncbi:MAG: hypothetical protein EB162_05375 [Euryarchaeota archaeon]|nr:hypothetical protein [Euryarchaeota archaeon]
MVDEEKFYENAEVVDVVGKEMTAQLKAQRDEVMTLYAKLIANPYLAPHLIPDFRSALMGTVATLMENGIPVSDNPKIRTPDDVIREGMAELAGMVGGSIAGKMMKAKQAKTVKRLTVMRTAIHWRTEYE